MPLPNQLNALLAMSASFRFALIGASSRIRQSQAHFFSTSLRHYAASKYPNIAAFLIPEFRTAQPAEITPEELFNTSSIPSAPGNSLQDGLTALFIKNPPTFQYSESDFYKLKKNTRLPEVCILGRSNVGKSSFVNALANRHSNVLAYVSSKAGKTKAMNTYGFGPAPLPKDVASQAAEYKGKEDIPTHTFYLVDMPGYGYASLKEWGHNIALFLTKRVGVKGAIVLIDAEVGPKQTDLQLLELLSSAEMRTAIVLTKADKVKGGLDGLRGTCVKLWDAIREIENKQEKTNWDWEKEMFVTAVGAKDHAVASATVTTARLAVARLAGLVVDNRPKQERNQKWSGKVVSFEDLQYAPNKSTPTPTPTQNARATPALSEARTATRSDKALETNSSFADLERASAEHRVRYRTRPRAFGSQNLRAPAQPYARAFHNSARPRDRESARKSQRPNSDELDDILDDFMNELKFANTTKNYAQNMRRSHDKNLPLPPQKRNIFEKEQRKQARYLQGRFPQETARIHGLLEEKATNKERQTLKREKKRVAITERQSPKHEKTATKAPEDWSTEPPLFDSKDTDASDVMTPDAFKEALTTSYGLKGPEKKQKTKKNKQANEKKGKGANVEQGSVEDDFEAKFSRAFAKNL
ncbi:hypothetical protein F4677DRAFT_405856 [Hypoxylon crocopeplum]|nr:hypothetical protein F4677DRAFT_405856 [Hypoxylon crocopeplum]